MRGKIPKTGLLVTFEAVARHESYTRAAEESALTQSTAFRQVDALEDLLNVTPLNHTRRHIFLNTAGRYYSDVIKKALNKFERDTTTTVAWQPIVQVIELAVNPTFSTYWLIPNLREFNKLNPDIIVNIHSLANIGDFLNRGYDAVIMYEDLYSPWSGVEYLFEEEILSIYSRCSLAEPEQELVVNGSLNELPLLHQSTYIKGWQGWFVLSEASNPLMNKGPKSGLLSTPIVTVRPGLGVALLPRFTIQHDLDSGDMAILCDVPMCTGSRFIMT